MRRGATDLPDSGELDSVQRRLLLGICLLVGSITLAPATFNFILNPMLDSLGASESQQSIMRQLPSIAALLVIFVSSVLAGRIGSRRVILIGAISFTVGSAVVAAAPVLPVATVGLVIESAAASAMAVVGLALLSARITNPKARATAFSTFALVAPVIYMGMPVIAGVILDRWSWRLVPAIWAIGGLVLLWGVRFLFPPDGSHRESAELLTPALAGLALAATVQTITAINHAGLLSTATLIRFAVAVISALALVICYRRADQPSISIAVLRRGGSLVLLVVVILVPFVNLWFYMTIGYQYLFGMSALQTALLMVPAQLAGVAGALVARALIRSRGITVTGVSLLLALAACLLLTMLITLDSPIWFTVVIMALYAIASVGASVPITNSIMNASPAGEEGSASSFRGAATHIGTALGVIVMGTIVYGVIATSLGNTLGAEGLRSQESAQIAQTMRDGSTSEDASAQYAVPVDQVASIDSAQKSAMIDGLHANGLAGAILLSAAALIFAQARRRQSIADR